MQVLIGKKENGDFAGELSINQRLDDEIATFYPLNFCQWLRKKMGQLCFLSGSNCHMANNFSFSWSVDSIFIS